MLKFKVQRFPTSPGSFSACVPHGVAFKDAFTANDRVHDPSLCSCPRFNDLLLSPKRLSPKRLVAQMTLHRWNDIWRSVNVITMHVVWQTTDDAQLVLHCIYINYPSLSLFSTIWALAYELEATWP